jgi:hypothetical protein
MKLETQNKFLTDRLGISSLLSVIIMLSDSKYCCSESFRTDKFQLMKVVLTFFANIIKLCYDYSYKRLQWRLRRRFNFVISNSPTSASVPSWLTRCNAAKLNSVTSNSPTSASIPSCVTRCNAAKLNSVTSNSPTSASVPSCVTRCNSAKLNSD